MPGCSSTIGCANALLLEAAGFRALLYSAATLPGVDQIVLAREILSTSSLARQRRLAHVVPGIVRIARGIVGLSTGVRDNFHGRLQSRSNRSVPACSKEGWRDD